MPDLLTDPRSDTDGPGLLRAAGLRVTAPRVATLAVLAVRPHADADAVAREVRARLGAVSTQAVYDVLRALHAGGLVRRIEPAGSSARYELRVGDNHHHVVCRGCGDVQDVDCAVGEAPCLVEGAETANHRNGFVVDEAEIVFWGLCPGCQVAASASPPFSQPLPTKGSKGPR